MLNPQIYEKLGLFYLGRRIDASSGAATDQPVLYESRDLTTHAAIIGMTGSGKTGLGIGMLEEAALDGIPVIAIDPKGDLGNLLLTFPSLQPADFEPWVNPRAATDAGLTPTEYAKRQATLWRDGLASWGQDGERIRRLREAADFAIYTPGSDAGLGLSVLGDFAPPAPAGAAGDGELERERLASTVSALLTLIGLEVDALTSREHLLLTNILQHAWARGQTLTLAELIHQVQRPPFDRLGVMALDGFYPEKDRFGLAMRLNALLASPGFELWMRGEPLSAERLLYTGEGRPRVSVVYIAHLNDQERMFIVCRLLAEVIGWMRAQPGTTSLRAVLYMDEVFGFLPPVANPPAKALFLTLLKQARAYGLGLVLATQNPVDLDYRALSNTGTWLIGRLQTERDKLRVRDGLTGAAGAESLDPEALLDTLSGLGKRRFLLHNVHERSPQVFETRWAMSYLPGPLTRAQIAQLMQPRRVAPVSAADTASSSPAPAAPTAGLSSIAPLPPAGVDQFFLPPAGAAGPDRRVCYSPSLLAAAQVAYHSVRHQVDTVVDHVLVAVLEGGPQSVDWEAAEVLDAPLSTLHTEPQPEAVFEAAPAAGADDYRRFEREFKTWLRTQRPLLLYRCPALKATSQPGESAAAFRARMALALREARDRELAAVRAKFADRNEAIEERLRRARQAVEREAEQARGSSLDAVMSVGGTVLGMLVGRKRRGSGLSTVSRRVSNTMKQRGDVKRAEENVEALEAQRQELEAEAEATAAELEGRYDTAELLIEELPVRAKSADISVRCCALLWRPTAIVVDGERRSA